MKNSTAYVQYGNLDFRILAFGIWSYVIISISGVSFSNGMKQYCNNGLPHQLRCSKDRLLLAKHLFCDVIFTKRVIFNFLGTQSPMTKAYYRINENLLPLLSTFVFFYRSSLFFPVRKFHKNSFCYVIHDEILMLTWNEWQRRNASEQCRFHRLHFLKILSSNLVQRLIAI